MAARQLDWLDPGGGMPEGLLYSPDFVEANEEAELVRQIARLPLSPFEFQGFTGKRRVLSFGWEYVFDGSGLRKAREIPGFLEDVRRRAAGLAGLDEEALSHVLLTEYAPGAAIGWHRDRPVFGEVVGISLLAPARLRFRRKAGRGWERFDLLAEPRSAYLLRGTARTKWEHSIPEMESLRYSITFRTLRSDPG